METHDFDVVIIGAGPGGYALALDCGRRGLKVALVEERDKLGGTCLNIGCIPSKALLESSELYYRLTSEAPSHGILLKEAGLGLDVDLKAMMARKDQIIETLTGGIAKLMKARDVKVFQGRGTVIASGKVTVSSGDNSRTETEIHAPKIVLATGSVAFPLSHMPFDGKRILSSTEALSMTKVPKSLAVIGAGAVGLELGSVWSRLGASVTVIEAMDQIVPGCDAQASRTLKAALKKQGITIKTGSLVDSAEISSRKVRLSIRKKSDAAGDDPADSIDVEKVLVAVGRRANLDSALSAGIDPLRTADGQFFVVDEGYATSIPGIYAIGDLIGNPMLAHKAEDEALSLAAILAGAPPLPWGGPIPGIIYTEPELAWAGETEDSLKASGTPFQKGYFPYAANARALAAEASEGFVKLLSSPGDTRLLGAVMVGKGSSELISEAVSIMAMGGCAGDIALTVHAHPSLSEITKEAALDLIGRPLHRS